MIKKFVVSLILLVAFVLTPSVLDARTGRDHMKAMEGMKRLRVAERVLFSVKGIMRHKEALGITEKQERVLRDMSEKFYEYEVRQRAEVKMCLRMKLHSYLRDR